MGQELSSARNGARVSRHVSQWNNFMRNLKMYEGSSDLLVFDRIAGLFFVVWFADVYL